MFAKWDQWASYEYLTEQHYVTFVQQTLHFHVFPNVSPCLNNILFVCNVRTLTAETDVFWWLQWLDLSVWGCSWVQPCCGQFYHNELKMVLLNSNDKAQGTGCGSEEDQSPLVTPVTTVGVNTDNKVDVGKNTDALYRKGQSHLHFEVLQHLQDSTSAQGVFWVCGSQSSALSPSFVGLRTELSWLSWTLWCWCQKGWWKTAYFEKLIGEGKTYKVVQKIISYSAKTISKCFWNGNQNQKNLEGNRKPYEWVEELPKWQRLSQRSTPGWSNEV